MIEKKMVNHDANNEREKKIIYKIMAKEFKSRQKKNSVTWIQILPSMTQGCIL